MDKNMKKAWAILLSLLLAATLVACASVSESENTAPAITTGTSEPEQATESEKAPASENTPHSGVLLVSDEEAASNVQVYHVAEGSFTQSELAHYKVVDLNDLDFYHEYVDSYQELTGASDTLPRIIFMADAPVKDFRYLEIETVFEDELAIIPGDTLYQLDALTPEEPFVVNWISIGEVGMYRGISFVDEDGITRYFSFNTSGYDGDMYLIEFKAKK